MEKHYFDLLKPEYNISKDPSHPFLGRTHTDEARAKLSTFFKGKVYPERSGENNSMFGKTHSEEIRLKISEGRALDIPETVIATFIKRKQVKAYKKRVLSSESRTLFRTILLVAT
ncbi:hypothetical protein EAE99_011589 [Botrytis elliptica]|nr:hypothetical protein EAE99_011589 [Botrytis elliptica]